MTNYARMYRFGVTPWERYGRTPEAGIAAIGSGGNYALAAARALVDYEQDAETICRKAMGIAADVCVFTNGNLTIEALDAAA